MGQKIDIIVLGEPGSISRLGSAFERELRALSDAMAPLSPTTSASRRARAAAVRVVLIDELFEE